MYFKFNSKHEACYTEWLENLSALKAVLKLEATCFTTLSTHNKYSTPFSTTPLHTNLSTTSLHHPPAPPQIGW